MSKKENVNLIKENKELRKQLTLYKNALDESEERLTISCIVIKKLNNDYANVCLELKHLKEKYGI